MKRGPRTPKPARVVYPVPRERWTVNQAPVVVEPEPPVARMFDARAEHEVVYTETRRAAASTQN